MRKFFNKLTRRTKGEVSLSNVMVLGVAFLVLYALREIWKGGASAKISQTINSLISFN